MMASPGYKSNAEFYKCPNCGMLFTAGQGLCMNCGSALLTREKRRQDASLWWKERDPENYPIATYFLAIVFVISALCILFELIELDVSGL